MYYVHIFQQYRVIHKSLWDFWTLWYSSRDGHSKGDHINSYRHSPSFFGVLGAEAYLHVSPLGGSRDETWGGQGIRKRSVSWNLPKLSQSWWCNGGFGPHTTQKRLWTKQFVNGTWNSSRVVACALQNEQTGHGWPVHFAVHRQQLYWNFMYLSRIVLCLGVSVWYVVRNHRCIVTIDSVLANSKTQNVFLFPVHAMFHHDWPLAVKSAGMPQRLVHKKNLRDSLPIDMLSFSMTIPSTVLQRSEIPEGLVNYPVCRIVSRVLLGSCQIHIHPSFTKSFVR
jgi:hypothetical protein